MTYHNIYPTDPQTEHPTPERCHITEIFNGPQHPLASFAQARVEPGVTTANHLLRDTEEWYYILSGTGDMYLNGELIGHVSAGDVVHIPANTPQFIGNPGLEDLVFLCVCVPGFREEVYMDADKNHWNL